MRITVEHEICFDKNDPGRCLGDGDFYGTEVCPYYKERDRSHGRKSPVERNKPKCTLFNKWLSGKYVRCDECRAAVDEALSKDKQEYEDKRVDALRRYMENLDREAEMSSIDARRDW